eukprot:930011-Lingulodinium_polyedra.AAC.1
MVAVCSAILGTCVARASVWAVMASSFFRSTPHLPSTWLRRETSAACVSEACAVVCSAVNWGCSLWTTL